MESIRGLTSNDLSLRDESFAGLTSFEPQMIYHEAMIRSKKDKKSEAPSEGASR
jgi:hypothetical protein